VLSGLRSERVLHMAVAIVLEAALICLIVWALFGRKSK
jgi:Ni,Fe-hydrogenase I cytochrome b subunit